MKLVDFILVIFLGNNLNAQDSSFIKIFDNEELGYEYVGHLFQCNPLTLKLYSTGRISDEYGGVFKMREIHLLNESVKLEILNNDRGSSIDASYQYYSVGLHSDGLGTDNYDLQIVGFRNEGIAWQYQYGIKNNFERGYGIDQDKNDHLVACGLVAKQLGGVDNESVVIKLDTVGNEIWTKKIRARYNELKARAVATDSESNIYVLSDEESLFPSIQQVALIKLNSQGDSLWTKYYPGGGSLAKDIKYNQDGNLTASVTADYDGQGRSYTMMEMDTSGMVLWTKSYIEELGLSPFAERFIELKEGGYAVCLNIGYPVLLVLDKQGNVVNEQHFEGYGVNNVKDIIELHDGSFAIAGNISEFNQEVPKTMWFIKTNSQGELITSTIEDKYPNFKIYPNPTSEIITVEGVEYDSVLLLNSVGQLMARYTKQKFIDLSYFPNGTYYLTLQTKKGQYTKKVVKR